MDVARLCQREHRQPLELGGPHNASRVGPGPGCPLCKLHRILPFVAHNVHLTLTALILRPHTLTPPPLTSSTPTPCAVTPPHSHYSWAGPHAFDTFLVMQHLSLRLTLLMLTSFTLILRTLGPPHSHQVRSHCPRVCFHVFRVCSYWRSWCGQWLGRGCARWVTGGRRRFPGVLLLELTCGKQLGGGCGRWAGAGSPPVPGSCHVMSRHVMSCHVMQCLVVSRCVASVIPSYVTSCVALRHVASCRVVSCLVVLCRVMSCRGMSRPAVPCRVVK